ncbi:unnamed protein product [Boreogadus saida]
MYHVTDPGACLNAPRLANGGIYLYASPCYPTPVYLYASPCFPTPIYLYPSPCRPTPIYLCAFPCCLTTVAWEHTLKESEWATTRRANSKKVREKDSVDYRKKREKYSYALLNAYNAAINMETRKREGRPTDLSRQEKMVLKGLTVPPHVEERAAPLTLEGADVEGKGTPCGEDNTSLRNNTYPSLEENPPFPNNTRAPPPYGCYDHQAPRDSKGPALQFPILHIEKGPVEVLYNDQPPPLFAERSLDYGGVDYDSTKGPKDGTDRVIKGRSGPGAIIGREADHPPGATDQLQYNPQLPQHQEILQPIQHLQGNPNCSNQGYMGNSNSLNIQGQGQDNSENLQYVQGDPVNNDTSTGAIQKTQCTPAGATSGSKKEQQRSTSQPATRGKCPATKTERNTRQTKTKDASPFNDECSDDDGTNLIAPLMTDAWDRETFSGYGHRERLTLSYRLPTITAGAVAWIRAFEEETAGDVLAMGDVRALIGRAHGSDKRI